MQIALKVNMSLEDRLTRFLTDRNFKLVNGCYVKDGLNITCSVTVNDCYVQFKVTRPNPDNSFSCYGYGIPIIQTSTFQEEDLIQWLNNARLTLFSPAELTNMCVFCQKIAPETIRPSDGGSNYCPTCGPWHHCRDGPIKGSPGPLFCKLCNSSSSSSEAEEAEEGEDGW